MALNKKKLAARPRLGDGNAALAGQVQELHVEAPSSQALVWEDGPRRFPRGQLAKGGRGEEGCTLLGAAIRFSTFSSGPSSADAHKHHATARLGHSLTLKPHWVSCTSTPVATVTAKWKTCMARLRYQARLATASADPEKKC